MYDFDSGNRYCLVEDRNVSVAIQCLQPLFLRTQSGERLKVAGKLDLVLKSTVQDSRSDVRR